MQKSVRRTEINPDLPLFSRRLKAARLLAGLSQEKLGVAAGVDEFSASARINQYERGKHMPDVLMATHLARALNIPLSYFYSEDEDEAELLLYYYRLPVRKRKQVLRLATELMAS